VKGQGGGGTLWSAGVEKEGGRE